MLLKRVSELYLARAVPLHRRLVNGQRGYDKLATLNNTEKLIPIVGDRRWPNGEARRGHKCYPNFYFDPQMGKKRKLGSPHFHVYFIHAVCQFN